MANPVDPDEARRLIESSGQIHMYAFEVSIGVLFGLAICCFIGRMVVRLKYQKALRLDDVFVIIAAASLCAATGILYNICYFLYMHSAALLVPEVLPYVLAEYSELISIQKKVYPFLALIWTTTFAVKGCFLVFMRPIIWHISRLMNWYYWFIVVFCVLCWMFAVSDPFIMCPYFGEDSIKCFTSTVDSKKTLALTVLITILDILSDLMVISLPIIALRGSSLARSTKLGMAVFLCLSIFMAICAIIKMAGFHYRGLEDDVWEFFWQYIEGAVAVMMASITAFRTLFVKSNNDADASTPHGSAGNLFHRLFTRFQVLARAQPEEKPAPSAPKTSMLKLPKLPSPVFTGMRTFMRENNRTTKSVATGTTATTATMDSTTFDLSEADYHATLKTQAQATTHNTPSHDRP